MFATENRFSFLFLFFFFFFFFFSPFQSEEIFFFKGTPEREGGIFLSTDLNQILDC